MPTSNKWLPFCLLLLLIWTGSGLATIKTLPVAFKSNSSVDLFQPGEVQHLDLEMVVRYPAVVTDIRLGGRNWTASPVDRTLLEIRDEVEIYRLEFDVSTTDPDQALEFSYVLDGTQVTRSVDFSNDNLRGLKTQGTTKVISSAGTPNYSMSGVSTPRFDPLSRNPRVLIDPVELGSAPGDDPPVRAKVARSITVSGEFGYQRGSTWMPAYGATVLIMADAWGPDTPLGSGRVDADGSFSIDTTWMWDPLDPDIYLIYLAGNSTVTVTPDTDTWYDEANTYSWRTTNYNQVEGTVLEVGRHAADNGNKGALQIMDTIQRANAWLYYMRQYTGVPQIHVHWPAPGSVSYYTTYGGSIISPDEYRIYMTGDATWEEKTAIHEYGHHFVQVYGVNNPPEYCNGTCDTPDCGHCLWCSENDAIAFTEGLPNWMSQAVCRDWGQRYGFEPRYSYNFETIARCDTVNFGYPYNTEGFFAALLLDIEDPDNDWDQYSPTYRDRLNLQAADILEVVDVDMPTTSYGFIDAFKDRHLAEAQDFWETCINNGFDAGDTEPPVTAALSSPTHTPFVISTSNNVVLDWGIVFDDQSGVGGYSLTVNPGSAALAPDFVKDYERVRDITVRNLAAGSYTFAIRAVDRAGNWDPGFKTYGPVFIKEPDPGDLRATRHGAGWDYPLVPKDTQTASLLTVTADTSPLFSNTYWNGTWQNSGDIAMEGSAGSRILVDGVSKAYVGFGIIEPHDYYPQINRGPISVPGGRHTMELFVDCNEQLAETDEIDNHYGHQWIWIPELLTYGTVHTRSAPPIRDAGYESVTDQLRWYNCDGLSFYTLAGAMPSSWAVVAAHAEDNYYNVDLDLHDAPTGAQEGFDYITYQATSGRPAGYLDALIVNEVNRPAMNYTVGVTNNNPYGMSQGYRAQVEYGQDLASAVPFDGALATNEAIALFTFDVASPQWYQIHLQLDDEVDASPVYAAWYDQNFSVGELLDYNAVAVTGYGGTIRLDIYPAAGTHGLILWRDPVDDGLSNEAYTLTVGPPPPDLTFFQPAGWDAPVIPAPGQTVTPTSGPEPTNLIGESAPTYVNATVRNLSSFPSTSFQVGTFVEGDYSLHTVGPLAGGAHYSIIPTTYLTSPGGRHVASMRIDVFGEVAELDERNNSWGSQYVWGPATIPIGTITTRSEPPYPTQDWEKIPDGEILYYNCDGIDINNIDPVGSSGRWAGVGIMPGPLSDADLRLFEPHTSPRDGFDIPLVESSWVIAQSDFVLMNFHNTALHHFEAGVIQGTTKMQEDYNITLQRSIWNGDDPDGVIGTWSFASGHFLRLHEFRFTTPGSYVATLDIGNPAMDLGFSLYGPDQEYYAKEDVQNIDSAAWLQPAGVSETFTFNVQAGQEGFYCLAVWRAGNWDGLVSGSYTLTVEAVQILPDAMVFTPAGWDATVVPRPALDASSNWAPLPATIAGDSATTYFNFAFITDPNVEPGPFEVDLELDGVPVGSAAYPGGGAGYPWYELDTNPDIVTGGRHTLALLIDPYEDITELDETNNTYGTQYVWSPKILALNTPDYRTDPKPYFTGWENITDGSTLWYNCDAVRTPYFDPSANTAFWACVAIMPEDLSNVNLSLHALSTGFTDGFTTPLESSNFPAGLSDFVLVNFNTNGQRQFDAGITISESHNEEVKVVVTESTYLGQNPIGPVPGTQQMGSDDLVNLFEFYFGELGIYRVELLPNDANCDLGISLYGPDAQYYAKVDVFDDAVYGVAVSFMGSPGERESFYFTIDTAGYYVLAVWKVGAQDRASSSSYDLTFSRGGPSGVGDEEQLPLVTRLAGAYPNPFNPMTTVAFELDTPQDVRLEIFDLRGRLIRVVADEGFPAGRHERVWRGFDTAGRSVSSGVYLIRMTAGNTVAVERVSLLK